MTFRTICLLVLAIAVLGQANRSEAAISRQQRIQLTQVTGMIKKAGETYKAGDYKECGKLVEQAQEKLKKLVAQGDMQLYREAEPMFQRIGRAHALLELEGIAIAPFNAPEPPADKPKDEPAKPMPNPTPAPADSVTFTKDVAPILVKNCGRCHVTGMRGEFSMASYDVLMKGPEIGIVVAPGNPAGSRLIEIIDSGSMPPNGRGIPAPELAKLAEWVQKGAKFDGPDSSIQLTSLAPAAAGQPARTPAPTIKAATGKETVSFAKDIAPILIKNCNGCHIDAMQTQGGLNMDTFARLNRGGDNGAIINPGNAMTSMIIKKLKGEGDGQRMPAGGRPPLGEKDMQLISTWIQEGAALDGSGPDQPIKVMSALAWAKDATHEELMQRRIELATDNWKIGSPQDKPEILQTDNFYIMGSVGPNTLKVVAEQAEAALADSMTLVRKPLKSGEPIFKGRTSIFVFPRRYDYSEFGSMIERRTLPQAWTEHWKFDGVDAYAALVVSSSDEDSDIKARLVGPMASLVIAQLGNVPRWISEGVGRATAAKLGGRDFEPSRAWDQELPSALASFRKPDDLLKGRLSPEQADLISYGIGQFMLDRSQKGKLDKMIRTMAGGVDFAPAFAQAYGGTPTNLLSMFGRWYQANAPRR